MKEDSFAEHVRVKESHLPINFSTKEIEDSLRLVSLYNSIEELYQTRLCRQLKPKRTARTQTPSISVRVERSRDSEDLSHMKQLLIKEANESILPKLKDNYLSLVKPNYLELKSKTLALAEEIDSKLHHKRTKTDYGKKPELPNFEPLYQPRSNKRIHKREAAKAKKTYYEYSLPIKNTPSDTYSSFKGRQSSMGKYGSRHESVSPYQLEQSVLRRVLKYVTVSAVL